MWTFEPGEAMVDFWAVVSSAAAKEVTATVLVVLVVIAIFTDQLIPGRAHRRELAALLKVADEHRLASERKDALISKLTDQNSRLLAGIRIADRFYEDFLPPAKADLPPPTEGSD